MKKYFCDICENEVDKSNNYNSIYESHLFELPFEDFKHKDVGAIYLEMSVFQYPGPSRDSLLICKSCLLKYLKQFIKKYTGGL